jgi:two-component system chemotaxis response regulator CheB
MKKVLVVDDSALMRKLLVGLLVAAGYDVKSARNGAEGVALLMAWLPDVVTLDINMPEMDGLTALSLIMAQRPTPVIMVSSLTEQGALATFEALALGAVDFIAKPGGTISLNMDQVQAMLLDKVRSAARAQVGRAPARARPVARPVTPRPPRSTAQAAPSAAGPGLPLRGLVLVGVSTGGPRTLEEILPQLPAGFPYAVMVAQHMPANFTGTFARRLDTLCALKVLEADTAMPLQAGHVYIGRGGTDLTVTERAGVLHAAPRPESPEVLWHPSVDVMVDSAMKHLPPRRLLGVLLTGMGNDGAAAMTRLHAEGGRTIAESADTAVVFGMPQELIERGGASMVLPSTGIAAQLRDWRV